MEWDADFVFQVKCTIFWLNRGLTVYLYLCEPDFPKSTYAVQKYLENHLTPGAVLLTSVPPTKGWKLTVNALKKFPTQSLKGIFDMTALYNDIEFYRKTLFNDRISEKEALVYQNQMCEESLKALLEITGASSINIDKVKNNTPPLLNIVANNDKLIPAHIGHDIGIAYGINNIHFPEMSHNVMLDPDWEKVANTIVSWIQSLEGNIKKSA